MMNMKRRHGNVRQAVSWMKKIEGEIERNIKNQDQSKCIDYLFECREQMNFGTAYLDGSGIYGATPESADKLREFKRGFLKVIKSSWPTSRKWMKEAKSGDFFN